MDITSIHTKLKEISSENLPNILFTEKIWLNQIETFTKEFFGDLKFDFLETPLIGIYANISSSMTNLVTNAIDSTTIEVKNYKVEFELKTKENPTSFLSQHVIIFSSMIFKVTSKDGKISIRKESEQYKSFPPSLNTDDERTLNFDVLFNNYNYSHDQIDYFITNQEPIAGLLVANGLLERFNKNFNLIDFSIMFPRIIFSGDFKIENIDIQGQKFVSFIPKLFEKKEASKCEQESVYNQTFSNGEYSNGEFKVGGGIYSTTYSGKTPNPNIGREGEIFLFLPNEVTKKLVEVNNTPNSKSILAKSEDDDWEIPPYLISHKLQISADKDLTVSWDNLDPTLNVKLGVYIDFYIKLWIKVFRIKTKIGSADTSSEYVLDYKGKLLELYGGDLGFVGELWDPSNFKINTLDIDTVLPDWIDKIASKVLKYILEPTIRFFITKIMITVTWPLISKYIFYGLSAETTNISSNVKEPNRMPIVEITEFKSDIESMTIGIKRNIDG
jgi:hypothetical protein